MKRFFKVVVSLLSILALFVALREDARAQSPITVYPTLLYSDKNEITVTARDGIRDIEANGSYEIKIEGTGPGSCENERTLRLFITSASVPISLNISVTDCKGRQQNFTLVPETVWTLDQVSFGLVEEGTSKCRQFQVRSTGSEPIWLDRISVDDPNASLELPTGLPVHITGGETYYYTVCYDADEIGEHTFPVTTWIRRTEPSAGETTYPVADTGYVRVIPPRIESLKDPTTFRSVGVPNAVIPKKGTLYVGTYDLLGLTAGYSLDDRLMVIVGGAIPTPDDWTGIHSEIFGAWSLGVKLGLRLDSLFHLALGYQYGTSIYDKAATEERESEITLSAPYIVGSYGDDDSRVSLTLGHAFKSHRTFYPPYRNFSEFKRNAWLGAIGGDYRFARHWKVAGEVAYMQTAGVLPVIATVRYFSRTWAVDVGVAYVGITLEGGTPPVIPVLPVVSGVFVF
jgi:hypothetical protein